MLSCYIHLPLSTRYDAAPHERVDRRRLHGFRNNNRIGQCVIVQPGYTGQCHHDHQAQIHPVT